MAKSIHLIPFLPSDADDAASCSSPSPALAASAAALRAALALSDADFWAWASSRSRELALCLDSYLQFARRPHDVVKEEREGKGKVGGGDGAKPKKELSALHRTVLLVLLRLAEGDFPSSSSSSSSSSSTSSPLETAASLLTLPRVLDACALYLPSNPSLARSLARRAWRRCHATLPQALDGALPAVSADLDGVREALETKLAARRREKMMMVSGSEGGSNNESTGEILEILDGLSLWRDSCFSLAALAAAHRGAAGAMLEACGGGLVASLAGAHDELIPAVEAAFFRGASSSSSSSSSAEATGAAEKVGSFLFFSSFLSSSSSSTDPTTTTKSTRLSEPPGLRFLIKTPNGHERSFSSVRKQRLAVRYPSKLRHQWIFFLLPSSPLEGLYSSSSFTRLFGMIPAPHTLFATLSFYR